MTATREEEAYARAEAGEPCDVCGKTARDWFHIPADAEAEAFFIGYRCDDHPPEDDEENFGFIRGELRLLREEKRDLLAALKDLLKWAEEADRDLAKTGDDRETFALEDAASTIAKAGGSGMTHDDQPEAFRRKTAPVFTDTPYLEGERDGYNWALGATHAPAMRNFIESLLDADLLPEESRDEAKVLIGRDA